jgi:BlaI family penicillinase repressor
MARPRSTTLTEGEQRIMEVIWRLGEASVQDVTDALGATAAPIAYTTVLTMLRILADKKYVEFRKEGKAHVYVPVVTRDAARSAALKQLVKRFFDDSPEELAQHLLREEDIDLNELDRLNAKIQQAKGKRRK